MTLLAKSSAPRVVQSDLFGRDKVHRTAVKLAKSVPSIRATDLMAPVPLLDPLSQRQGRGRPTQRPIGMSQSTWMYWLRWCARHQIDHAAAEAMPEFLASHRSWKLNVARHRMSDASHDQPQHVWRTLRPWKDLTAAEEAEWRRRIRRGTTDGTYRIGLRGLQRLEVAR